MKILILGNSNNIWTVKYVEHVLNGFCSEIYVSDNGKITDDFRKFYERNGINLINTTDCLQLFGVEIHSELIRLINTIRSIKKIGTFDVLHMHYIGRTFLMAYYLTKKYYVKAIATFWGSDLLRHSKLYFRLFGFPLKYVDHITVATNEMKRDVQTKLTKVNADVVQVIKFGVSTLDTIDRISNTNTTKECKEYFGITPSKKVIAIGYNRDVTQRHIEVLNAIGKMDVVCKTKVCAVLQLTYGPKNDSYVEQIEEKLKTIGIEYIILKDYLNEHDIATLRLATEYFINAQPTDAFSATMQEHLYAGSIVINSSRLQYEELNEISSNLVTFDNLDELTGIINNLLEKGAYQDETTKVAIRKMSSWKNVSDKWKEIYEN